MIESTSAAVVGETISGSGYSFVVPEDWAERPLPGADVLAIDLTDADGFSDNVNVVLSPAGVITPNQMETLGVEELRRTGAKDVTVRDRVTVAGSESAHLSAGFSIAGTGYQVEQFAVTKDGQTYIVTFSFSLTVSVADRDDLSRRVLATWAWA